MDTAATTMKDAVGKVELIIPQTKCAMILVFAGYRKELWLGLAATIAWKTTIMWLYAFLCGKL